MIEIRNIHKQFGKTKVLRGVDLDVAKGEVVVILGPSGSGKTTFLRCINFLEKADVGTVRINNQTVDVTHASKKEMLSLRRRTAMVFQSYDLFLNKNAVGNVIEGLLMTRNVPKKKALEIGYALLERVGLKGKEKNFPTQLSGGEQQRVGIARALALSPDVILFDEPTSALDPEWVGETLDVIRQVAEGGATLVIVTHEMKFAYDVADKVVFMEDGVVVEQGTPQAVFDNPREERTRQFLSQTRFTNEPGRFAPDRIASLQGV